MNWRVAMLLGGMMAMGAGMAVTPEQHAQAIEAWRAERVERLRQPGGWLSLVGLHWIEPGTHRLGSDRDNDIVLAKGPGQLGTVVLEDGALRFTPAVGAGLELDGHGAIGTAPDGAAAAIPLLPDSSAKPSEIRFDGGRGSIVPIERGGRRALRVRHADAATRTGFTGIEHFAVDPSWRIEARYQPHPPGSTIDIANVIGQLEPTPNPGAVVFERDGKNYRLEAVDEGDGQLFLIFADRTSGKETYGAGRFLYADPPAPGSDVVVVDFNRAYNPPCAFNAYSTCPLPPAENRLDLAVAAGEKRYAGPTH